MAKNSKAPDPREISREIKRIAKELREARRFVVVIPQVGGMPGQIDIALTQNWGKTDGIIIKQRNSPTEANVVISLDVASTVITALTGAVKAGRARNTLLNRLSGYGELKSAVRELYPAFASSEKAAEPAPPRDCSND